MATETKHGKQTVEAASEGGWELLGDAFGRINEVQTSLAAVNAPLVKYLLDMAKMEIARLGTGLSFAEPGEDDHAMVDWIKALRDEEGEQQERPRRAN